MGMSMSLLPSCPSACPRVQPSDKDPVLWGKGCWDPSVPSPSLQELLWKPGGARSVFSCFLEAARARIPLGRAPAGGTPSPAPLPPFL